MKRSVYAIAGVLACCGLTHAGVVYSTDLTSGTYAAGALNGQDGWAASGGTVVAGTGVKTTGYENIVNGASSAASKVANGATYTSSITFTYNDNSGGVGAGPHYGASIYNGPATSDAQLSMQIRRTTTTYRLSLATNWGNTYPANIGFNQSGTFTPASIGITHGSDTLSDLLTLSIAATAGATINDWIVVGTLYNETTASQVFQYTLNGVDFAAAIGSTVYGGFGGGQSDANQNIANRTASSFTFESTIPEPATLGMVAAFGGTILFIRRRFMM